VPRGRAGFDALEARLLAGQRLQGALTAEEVASVLATRGWASDFPLFATIYAVTVGAVGPEAVLRYREVGAREGVVAVNGLASVAV
jgi:glycerol-3-phosphate dehydrogenase (NAD+)